MDQVLHLINGELRRASTGEWLENCDPATGAVSGQIADGTADDVDAAVHAAHAAFEAWSGSSVAFRSECMLQLAERIERDLEAFARAESIDNGKPIRLARAVDIPRAIANLRFFATAIQHETSQSCVTDVSATGGAAVRAINFTLRRPRGVAGCISPWNLPLYLFTWKIAPALATGNTVVAKPSEVTPVTAALLGQATIDLGWPPGVLNIVHGRGAVVGHRLVAHPEVPTISFTGGTETGATIARTAAPMFKKLSLELGGKNPNVIFADADFDAALETSVQSSFANQGQICLCGSRILVERSGYDSFVAKLVERAKLLRSGDPLVESTQQGALVSRDHRDKVQACIERARAEGGRVHCGGGAPAELPARCANGYFIAPTVITDLDPFCDTQQEEIFGPVVTVTPFDSEADAVGLANATRYGLAASIWTQDIDRAHRVAHLIDAGTVWINCWLLRDLRVPFGGMKESGVGREGGTEALEFFTEAKNVCVRIAGGA